MKTRISTVGIGYLLLAGKGQERALWGARNVLNLDLVVVTWMCTSKISPNCTLKIFVIYCMKLYLGFKNVTKDFHPVNPSMWTLSPHNHKMMAAISRHHI